MREGDLSKVLIFKALRNCSGDSTSDPISLEETRGDPTEAGLHSREQIVRAGFPEYHSYARMSQGAIAMNGLTTALTRTKQPVLLHFEPVPHLVLLHFNVVY